MDESTMTTIGIPVGSHSTFVSLFVKGGIVGFTAAVMGLVVLPLFMWIRAFFVLNVSSPLQKKLKSEAAILFNLQCLLWFWMAFDDVDAPGFRHGDHVRDVRICARLVFPPSRQRGDAEAGLVMPRNRGVVRPEICARPRASRRVTSMMTTRTLPERKADIIHRAPHGRRRRAPCASDRQSIPPPESVAGVRTARFPDAAGGGPEHRRTTPDL
jgi:hypothetical protein